MLALLMNLFSRLINRSGLRISHSKVFSWGHIGELGYPGHMGKLGYPGHIGELGYSGHIRELGYPGHIGELGYPGPMDN